MATESKYHPKEANNSVDTDDFHSRDPIACLESVREDETVEIHIYPNEALTFGREECHCIILDPLKQVSKKHFRIYSIIYEKGKHEVQPLVYCEDLESTNGTYVNDILIGQICHEKIGYLLNDGDVIKILPSWQFTFHQPNYAITAFEDKQRVDVQAFQTQFKVYERVLGSGQYGKVYLARELKTSRQIACKVIDLEHASKQFIQGDAQWNPKAAWVEQPPQTAYKRAKLMREIEILAKLSHPHIVNLRKAFCSETTLYIFTDLAPAGDLFSFVDSHGGFLADWHSRIIAYQTCTAINYLHNKGIVHRDIKPENILITQTDFGGRVVLTDFGFANYINKTTGRLTSKLGTRGYVAPEIDASEELSSVGYTMAADLWSFGMLTAFLLTGNQGVPSGIWPHSSQEQLLDRICGQEWTNIGQLARKFLQRLLVVDADCRMTAAEALDHIWFKKPRAEAIELQKGCKRITKYWKERDFEHEVITDLPEMRVPEHVRIEQRLSLAPKSRRGLPDVTLSPYFGLDRHLHKRDNSQLRRIEILAALNASSSSFITFNNPHMPQSQASNSRHSRDLIPGVRDVIGGDIFNSFSVESQDIIPG